MWYDVRFIEYHHDDYPVREIYHRRAGIKTPALSEADALDTFRSYHKNATPLYAKPLVNEWDTRDKNYWYDKWREAMAAMPAKIMQHKHRTWEKLPKGTTPLPEFIEGRAKGEMILDSGHVLKERVWFTSHEYGRAAALGILLGYITWTGADHKRKRANSCAMLGRKIPESSRPRDPKTRELLSKLGTVPQDEIKAMLAEKRAKMNG
jgi:hypothetical protein